MRSYEEIKNAAFALPPETRAMLAEDLDYALDISGKKTMNYSFHPHAEREWKRSTITTTASFTN
jgi:hypothetical protein